MSAAAQSKREHRATYVGICVGLQTPSFAVCTSSVRAVFGSLGTSRKAARSGGSLWLGGRSPLSCRSTNRRSRGWPQGPE